MKFFVTPEQVKRLKPEDFVALLGRLLYAEASKAEVPMSGISVPLQITIADGGEDGRFDCQWTGGRDFTSFLPNRFCIFQAKATKMGAAKWKAEAFTKASKRRAVPELNAAVQSAINNNATYIGFSKEDLGGIKIADVIKKIREGIVQTGTIAPSLQIDIYDTNKIAEWVRLHPSVALWLIEKIDGAKLVGYMSVEGWASRSQFGTTKYVDESGERFTVLSGGNIGSSNSLSAQDTAERIFDHLSAPRRSFRLLGHSGLGKTRYVTEIFKDAAGTLPTILNASAVFCDYREVQGSLLENANWYANQKTSTVLIVDECPAAVAQQLHNIASHAESLLRVLTINLDDVPIETTGFMCMKALPGADRMIDEILSQFIKGTTSDKIAYLRRFCAGFPKIAVILGTNYQPGDLVLTTAPEVIGRILAGAGISDREAIRAMEGLALFDALPADGRAYDEFDRVAADLCDMSGNRMYEHLIVAAAHDLVGERDRKLFVQLDPVADHLAQERLRFLRPTTIVRFIRKATSATVLSMARRWGNLPRSGTAQKVVTDILRDEQFASWQFMDGYEGSQLIAAFVDFWPERLSQHLLYTISNAADEISAESSGRRTLVYALTKLLFPKSTFLDASAALLILAAAENGNDQGVATKAFGQVFQSFLSGTEVPPDGRWVVIEDAVQTKDPAKIGVAIAALGRALSTSYLGRPGGTEQLGNRPPLKDWKPDTWGDVWAFQTTALEFLMRIWRENQTMRARIEQAIGSNLRNLMIPSMIESITGIVKAVTESGAVWTVGYKKIGDWLYYDSSAADSVFVSDVKALQERLFPEDIVDQAILFASFWPADLHDPDRLHKESDVKSDFQYGSRRGRETGDQIAKDQSTAERAIGRLIELDLPNVGPVVTQIGLGVADPIRLLRFSVWKCAGLNTRTAQSVVSSLVTALNARDPALTEEALEVASLASSSADWTQHLLSSVQPDAGWLRRVVDEVHSGNIRPQYAGTLSYGQRLNAFSVAELMPLLGALKDTNTPDGLWAVLEIVLMYRLSDRSADSGLLEFAKPILVAPQLLNDERQGRNDNHLFETLILAALNEGQQDPTFVRQLAEQIVRLCQVGTRVHYELDHAAHTVLPAVLDKDPATVWDVIARFYERATATERYMLSRLVAAGSDIYDHDLTKAGPLFQVHELAEKWAEADPSDRIGFVVSMYPMLVETDGKWKWTLEFDSLSKRFGKHQEFRDTVVRRIWELTGGYANEYAASLIAALKGWSARSELMLWANNVITMLEAQNP